MQKIAVLGSLNVDTTLHVERMPKPGETLSVASKSNAAGGKGANQAVAARRSGAEVSFIGRVGDDDEGRFMLSALQENGVQTDFITKDEQVGTGSATILLDKTGQNDILVFGGANQQLTENDVQQEQLRGLDAIIAQFETPQTVTKKAFTMAKAQGIMTILNPAPAQAIDPELLKVTDLVVPNETESAALTGIEVTDEASMQANAAAFKEMGVKNLIITIGSKGAFYATNHQTGFMPAFRVNAVDTTAAGDTFIGALTSELSSDFNNIEAAVRYGQRASSIAVQSLGAMPSIPTKQAIEMAENN